MRSPKKRPSPEAGKETEPVNPAIRQDLRQALTYHPHFAERGISKETLSYLGAGYWHSPKSRSPLNGRLIFQIRGIEENKETGQLKSVILTHAGYALDNDQIKKDGRWSHYEGFIKSSALYNLDNLLLDERAVRQTKERGFIILTEGCFDVAKLIESGSYNVIASLDPCLCEDQLKWMEFIKQKTGVSRVLVWFGRDEICSKGQDQAVELLRANGYQAEGFDWNISFPTTSRGLRTIPPDINDVCDFEIRQLRYLSIKCLSYLLTNS